ncbi:MAG: M1 family metallopeptidase [Clostridia bacterium]|nr:M1 family metallopeptidase [Clostridia bacterium]
MRLRSIIGKRILWTALPILLAVPLYFALRGTWMPREAGACAKEAAEGLDNYYYALIFRPEENELAVTLTLDFTNRTGEALDYLVLRTWAGAYASEETSPAAAETLCDACYPDGFSAGGVALEGAWWNGEITPAGFTDAASTVLTVLLPSPLAAGESGRLLLHCRLTVPECAHRFGHAQGVWQFGNALPILSVYENGAWRTDAYSPIGDPFVSDCANYTVTLLAPAGYQCAASAPCGEEALADGRTLFTMRLYAARDFSFALSDQWQTVTQRQDGVTVTACAPTQEGAARAAKLACKALRVYAGLYGDYAWDSLTLCAVDFPFGGMEYPGLVFLGLPYFAEDLADTLELLVAHEVAHQWFYALVGSDQYNDPWQDEALSEYAMLRYARAVYGESAYRSLLVTRVDAPMRERIAQRVTPGSPIDRFDSLDVYSAVVYGRGAAFLLAVEEMTGKLDGFLRAYCDQFAFRRPTRAEFLAFLNGYCGEDLAPLMTDYLDTLMNY